MISGTGQLLIRDLSGTSGAPQCELMAKMPYSPEGAADPVVRAKPVWGGGGGGQVGFGWALPRPPHPLHIHLFEGMAQDRNKIQDIYIYMRRCGVCGTHAIFGAEYLPKIETFLLE